MKTRSIFSVLVLIFMMLSIHSNEAAAQTYQRRSEKAGVSNSSQNKSTVSSSTATRKVQPQSQQVHRDSRTSNTIQTDQKPQSRQVKTNDSFQRRAQQSAQTVSKPKDNVTRPPQGSISNDRRPQGSISNDRRPQGSISNDRRPQGSISNDRRPQGSVTSRPQSNNDRRPPMVNNRPPQPPRSNNRVIAPPRPHVAPPFRPAPRDHYYGDRLRRMPRGYQVYHFGGVPYYYYQGSYYRHLNGYYHICRPPIGAFLDRTINRFASAVILAAAIDAVTDNYNRTGVEAVYYDSYNNLQYYYDDGFFFILDESGNYVVAQPPIGARVGYLPRDYEKVRYDGDVYYKVDYTLFKKIYSNGHYQFEVVGTLVD